VEVAPGVPAVMVSTLLVRAGDVVLECSCNGVTVETDWLAQVAAAVLAGVAR